MPIVYCDEFVTKKPPKLRDKFVYLSEINLRGVSDADKLIGKVSNFYSINYQFFSHNR